MNSLIWGLLIAGTVLLVLWYRGRQAVSQDVIPTNTATPAPKPMPSKQRTSAPSDDDSATGWELSDAETVVRPSSNPQPSHRAERPGRKD